MSCVFVFCFIFLMVHLVPILRDSLLGRPSVCLCVRTGPWKGLHIEACHA